MGFDYAKELVAVDCGRIVETLDAMRGAPLSEMELACWEDLRRAALRGVEVFKVTGKEKGC
jgi:hypothetical protein